MQLGLLANWRQFALLVLINAFMGGMVGLERTILPLLAEREFGIASQSGGAVVPHWFWERQGGV